MILSRILAESVSTFDPKVFELQLEHIVESLGYFGPELQVAVGALCVFLLDLFVPLRASRHLAWVAILFCFVPVLSIEHVGESGHSLFHGMISIDPFANFFKQLFLLGSIPVILLSFVSKQLEGRRMGEYYGILLAAVLGAMLMASSTHFLMLFMSLELLSICSYVLVGYIRRDRRGAEAALKYIIYGSVAAAIMIYGLSLLYGLTGSAQIQDLVNIQWDAEHDLWSAWTLKTRAAITALVGIVMVFMGLAYKMSTIPMHFWAPDVYDGAPTPVTAFLSVLSKAAGVALTLRFISYLPIGENIPEVWESIPWVQLLIVISIVTMTFGNFAALWQSNLKRMLAYSSIAHAGYLMMGLPILHATEVTGQQAIGYYLLAYLAMNFGAFGVIILIENKTGSVDLKQYRGLGKRAPFLAAAMVVFLFSLIGVPPTAGFIGKFHLFMGVIREAGQLSTAGSALMPWFYTLAIAAALNTAVSAYYYLKVAREMYLVESEETGKITSPILGTAVVAAMVVLTFFLFFMAEPIAKITSQLALGH
jgi:NADH-quinone oxidoreductase subunit N